MFNIKEHSPKYLALLRQIRFLASFGGFPFGDAWDFRGWKFYRIFCGVLYIIYVILNWSAIYTARHHPFSMLLQIGMSGGVLASLSCGCDLVLCSKKFVKIFIRIGKFEKLHPNDPHFDVAYKKSQKAIKMSVWFNSGRFFLVVLLNLIIQLLHKPIWKENGKFNIRLPLRFYLPFVGPPRGWITFAINYAFQFFGAFLSLYNYLFFMVIVSVLVLFSEASMDVVSEIIEKAAEKMKSEKIERYWNRKRHEKDIKNFIMMHVSIVENLQELTNIIFRTLFCLEIVLFVFTFFLWIAITVELTDIISNVAIALAAMAGILMYFWLAFLNGKLFDANEKFLNKVTDLPWYDWVSRDRQLLLPMILRLKYPSLLKIRGIGGLKDVTYERFGETIQSVYSCCLVIQKMLK